MKTPQLLILLLTILVHAAAAFPAAGGGREKHASWDDVNVVAHGLLQLGQGLKEHVDKTKAQMRDFNAKLKAFNGTLAELERRQGGGEVEEEEEEVKRQREELHGRMDRLEEKVEQVLRDQTVDSNNSEHTDVPLVQVRGR